MWLGIATGKRWQVNENSESKSQANAVQGSLLGLLALLLGFTFSLALGRFDERSAEVVKEANAIGTAWLRTDFVSEARRDAAKDLLRRYAEVRVEGTDISAARSQEREQHVDRAETLFGQLWSIAADEALDPGGPAAVAFATSLNDVSDALSSRDAAIERHVPEPVLYLLFGTFVVLGAVIGFTYAISGVRPGIPIYAMMMLIVVLVFLIIDLDRPRRGLIAVDQSKLLSTVEMMKSQ
ncbi:MAG: hypothetical protein H6895_09470 [Defluviimonas sp.]|uniref:bestrophin-like domain n=1 Tax=Albidovulum sp. TaxID=1872424 RepID=UPI002A2ACE6F|nr:hypothetical protein [Defluviimonas sp.]